MDLQRIVSRIAEGIEVVDASPPVPGYNTRTGQQYRRGFHSLGEEAAVREIDEAWERQHPGERTKREIHTAIPKLPRAKIDLVIDTSGGSWGIELKRLQLVGDNGKVNGFAVPKMLSPFLADRGLLHDALRLRDTDVTERVAVIAWCGEYDNASLAEARQRHRLDPAALAVVSEVEKVARSNGGHLRVRPLVEFADAIMSLRGLTTGARAEATYEASTHPAGGRGLVFGWEIRRPQLESDYDPRHPW